MNIKELIKALLQSKFGGVQLSQARIDALASRLDGKVTTEEELLQKLEALNELQPFSEIRAEDDRARSVQAELDKLKKPAPAPSPQPAPQPAPAPAEDPNKAILDAIKGLSDTVAGLKSEKVVTDRQSLIKGKLKDADADYSAKVLRDFGRMSFATEEDFTAYLGDIETDFATHVQTVAESKLGKDAPFMGIGDDGKVKEASEAEVTELFGDIKI